MSIVTINRDRLEGLDVFFFHATYHHQYYNKAKLVHFFGSLLRDTFGSLSLVIGHFSSFLLSFFFYFGVVQFEFTDFPEISCLIPTTTIMMSVLKWQTPRTLAIAYKCPYFRSNRLNIQFTCTTQY